MSKIEEIVFTDCNGSCQNTLSADKDKTFFKMTAFTFPPISIIRTVRLLECHGLSNHRILDCLLNSLSNIATKQTSFVRESILYYNL